MCTLQCTYKVGWWEEKSVVFDVIQSEMKVTRFEKQRAFDFQNHSFLLVARPTVVRIKTVRIRRNTFCAKTEYAESKAFANRVFLRPLFPTPTHNAESIYIW